MQSSIGDIIGKQSNMSVMIEIYKKSTSKPIVTATFHDDQHGLFPTTLFQEALYQHKTTSGDPFDVFPCTIKL